VLTKTERPISFTITWPGVLTLLCVKRVENQLFWLLRVVAAPVVAFREKMALWHEDTLIKKRGPEV
jgi:hypothetical protein